MEVRDLLLVLLAVTSCCLAQAEPESKVVEDDREGAPSKHLLTGAKCDRVYVSRQGQEASGKFEAPTLSNPLGHSRQCLLKFIAAEGQRVKVSFGASKLRGTYPDCHHEYLDFFSEMKRRDEDLLETPFGGRFCGRIPPRPRISLYNTLVMGFYTDQNYTDANIFNGTYHFINASRYNLGRPISGSPCSFELSSDQKRKGLLTSPTYPGVYPKGLSCVYRFIGKPGQRIRIEFRDFDLFMGGHHCPFDFVRIYDGANKTAPLIGTFCRPERNLVKYSTGENLLITFITIQRTPNPEKRGFSGIYEFSESFVNLDFITGQHIRGTECDQRILSKKESSGEVFSPNYPYPYLPNIVCKYFIYGMKDSQNLERVHMKFSRFDVSNSRLTKAAVSGADYDSDEEKTCRDGYLRIYLRGQEVKEAFDKYDQEFCGHEPPPPVRSNGPRFSLVFSSGQSQGAGFKADFNFETEYLIPGTAAPDGSCRFTYSSTARHKGTFNSPRHPANYPSATDCQFEFLTARNEQVRLVFDAFKVRADNTNGSAYGLSNCHEDWMEIHNIYHDNRTELIGRYCNSSTPGPTESVRGARGFRVILHTDETYVASGFKAHYIYFNAKELFGDCGKNISGALDGVVTSPNYPNKYPAKESKVCHWYIHVKPGKRILLYFDSFSVEGDRAARGCPAAVVRVGQDLKSTPIELCGDLLPEEFKQVVSIGNVMKMSFISAEKSVGNNGFRAFWTEIHNGEMCEGFKCEKNEFCVSEQLQCNRRSNCGVSDLSDEQGCATAAEVDIFMLLGVVLALVAVAGLVLCLWCRRRGQKDRHVRHPASPSHRHVHVCDHLGSRLSTMDTV